MEIESFIVILLWILLLLSYRFYQYVRCENILKKVKWIAEKSTSLPDDKGCYGENNLTYYMKTRNYKYGAVRIKGLRIETLPLEIPNEFQIDFNSEEEKQYVSEILESYRRNVIDNLSKEDRVSLSQKNKAIYKLRDLDYFMFSLLCYIQNCVDYDSYLFTDKIYEHKEYSDNSHFSCQLTSYGRVYYKIYLVASMYCENNDYMKSLIIQPQSNHIMGHLKTNKVGFWSYRP